jgi:hypothetical protein
VSTPSMSRGSRGAEAPLPHRITADRIRGFHVRRQELALVAVEVKA